MFFPGKESGREGLIKREESFPLKEAKKETSFAGSYCDRSNFQDENTWRQSLMASRYASWSGEGFGEWHREQSTLWGS